MRNPLILIAFLALLAVPAWAQQSTPPAAPTTMTLPSLPAPDGVSMPPADELTRLPALDASAMDDNAPIRLSPDGPTVVHLNRDAGTVIVGNPNHASVVMENPRMLMLMPGQPGATKIMALDRDGRSILDRHVLVGTGQEKFMRINRVCALGADNKACTGQSVYYCPDKCYETTVSGAAGNVSAGGAPTAGPAPVADVPTETVQETVE